MSEARGPMLIRVTLIYLLVISTKRTVSDGRPVFGAAIGRLEGGAVEVNLFCRCMERGGHYCHETSFDTEIWADGEYRQAELKDLPALVDGHFHKTHPEGYFHLHGHTPPRRGRSTPVSPFWGQSPNNLMMN